MTDKIFIIDKETGKATELHPVPHSVSFSTKETPDINIRTSYNFECRMDIRNYYAKVPELYCQSWEWNRAKELADRLNDIIEEYHAPGTSRRERRALQHNLQRKFRKTFQQFDQHCRMYKIIYNFINQ